MDSYVTGLTPLSSNFLVPNFTFVVELIAFVIMFGIIAKWIIPPINRAMTARQDAIRAQFAELDEAKAEANATEEQYRQQLEQARHEAAKIREDAREQGAQIVADARTKAEAEAKRIIDHAHTQIDADRQAAATSLRAEVGTMATTLAGRIVGESLDDQAQQSRVVERFLDELEASGSNA